MWESIKDEAEYLGTGHFDVGCCDTRCLGANIVDYENVVTESHNNDNMY